ncbi:hypothetical protein [Ferruginibacter albus]|uniref:hypothetical protein n=1 Tax=Ferruginibacter albus TaxID=2875540 RepID=UPI001CC5DBB3|nr:hypothetical protein [Ferruginibacter albus]UAY52310.1 hypothetical protein K9M53_01125 [Ferruginibacter albus]
MKTKLLIIISLLFALHSKANMASPVQEGTKTSAPFSSKDINILSETIHISINKEFTTAKYVVEYSIETDSTGKQIPLLFYAENYKDDFIVWVDDQKVTVQQIPDSYKNINDSPFSVFANSIKKASNYSNSPFVTIYWSENYQSNYEINDLKYFEASLTKGTHKIRVEYTANAWTDRNDWVAQHSFRYSLTPAKFWKSFGKLDVYVESEGDTKPFTTNLGEPNGKTIQQSNSWSFNKLPDDYIDINYMPKINVLAKVLVFIDPFGIAVISGILFFMLHLRTVRHYRNRYPTEKFSLAVIIGSLVIPLAVLFIYLFSFDFIDTIIGSSASRFHGYVFFCLLLYPILLPLYWIIMWRIDKMLKKKLAAKNAQD